MSTRNVGVAVPVPGIDFDLVEREVAEGLRCGVCLVVGQVLVDGLILLGDLGLNAGEFRFELTADRFMVGLGFADRLHHEVGYGGRSR
jgi:hypothetical protein